MNAQLIHLIDLFRTKKILVIGDAILDVYLRGRSTRLSPEAPVPVVDIIEERKLPGGAANVALNLKALGAQVFYCSVVGKDHEGATLIHLLEDAGVNTQYVEKIRHRATIVKTRVVAGGQMLIRFDSGEESPVGEDVTHRLLHCIGEAMSTCDAIVISDYNKGLITANMIDNLFKMRDVADPKFMAVDSKRLSDFKILQPSFVKPNYDEAIRLLDANLVPLLRGDGAKDAVGSVLLESTGAGITTVTLDEDGSLIFEQDRFVRHIPAPPVQSPQVSGAGDTYLSVFTLASVCGADAITAAELATAAASISVGKSGTACCAAHELTARLNTGEKCITSLHVLVPIVEMYKAQGRRIVFTNGCFDILHSGHVDYLARARALGDVLIVGINTDESIRRIKGLQRPINPLSDRIQVLSGLRSIDHIIPFGAEDDDTPIPLIRAVKPHVFAKGGDYTKEKLPEASTVEEAGGEIIFLPHVPDHSTTQIIQRIHQSTPLRVA